MNVKEMYGLPLSKAEGLIFRFFGDNAELIETFVETAADMIDSTAWNARVRFGSNFRKEKRLII